MSVPLHVDFGKDLDDFVMLALSAHPERMGCCVLLCAVCCVLCAVCRVLCAVCCVLCFVSLVFVAVSLMAQSARLLGFWQYLAETARRPSQG